MLLHDRIGHRQAEARALADLFRRKKRIEDLRLQIFRNSRAIVIDFEEDGLVLGVVPGADDENAAAVR